MTDPIPAAPERPISKEERMAAQRAARSAARLAAVQALYQMEITGASWKDVYQEFQAHRLGAEIEGAQYIEADLKFFRTLLEGVVGRQAQIDQATDAALVEKWPLGKVDATLRAVFRCAGFELAGRPATPFKVVISEYVDVTKAFFDAGQESRFVNAVLDQMAKSLRSDPAS